MNNRIFRMYSWVEETGWTVILKVVYDKFTNEIIEVKTVNFTVDKESELNYHELLPSEELQTIEEYEKHLLEENYIRIL